LRVEVTAKRSSYAAISTSFVEFSRARPDRAVIVFKPPGDADLDYVDAPDIAAAISTFSAFVLPEEAAGVSRRSSVGEAGGTYGTGYDLVAALVLPGRYLRRMRRALGGTLAPVDRPYGEVTVISAPLLNGLLVVPGGEGGYGYLVSGSVSAAELERFAAGLVAVGVEGG